MLSTLDWISRSRFPASLTGNVAEQASVGAQQSREHVFAIVRAFDHFVKTQRPAGFVILVLLRKIWQISASLSGDKKLFRR
jgi:hypothetical protein